jgi:ABC-2 type transport system ATP-binding protein
MMETIRVSNISKKYFLRKEANRTLKSTFLSIIKHNRLIQDFWALKELNFAVEKGETFGIIGANGAGKSTLLGIIAKTITPTEGKVEIEGRISSLLELGAGFHPELTGRENIYLNGSILGLSREYIRSRFDDIVAFAELAEFIDMPVKHYSSGMYVRLGFSVAVQTNPDILLVDEVLAVGDETFRRKCLAKLAEFRQAGKTIVVVSHDLDTVRKICDRVMLIAEGKTIEIGDPTRVVEEYSRLGAQHADIISPKEWGTRDATIADIELLNRQGIQTDQFSSGDEITARICYETKRKIDDPIFGFSIRDVEGRLCVGSNTINGNFKIENIEGKGNITLTIGPIALARGKFFVSFSLHSRDHKTNYHRLDNKYTIWVSSKTNDEGIVAIKSRWSRE